MSSNDCCCCLLTRLLCPCIYNACCRDKKYASNNNGVNAGQASEATTRNGATSPKPPPKPDSKKSRTIVRALYDFEPRQDDEVAFKKNDRMEVIDKNLNSDWWLVKHLQSKQSGYAPSNYVVIDDNRPESQDWWFAIDRREAEKQLLLPGNPKGTFLIRNSADNSNYALSIRHFDDISQTVYIKHYKIHKDANGEVHIASLMKFNDLLELVDFYQSSVGGLCCKLSKACPREPEPVPFKECEVDRKDITLGKKLGQGQFGEVFAGKLCRTVDVAVKTLKTGTMTSSDFLAEAKAMHQLRHRKLVLLMGVCTKIEPYYIITEMMVNGSLLEYLKKETVQPNITFPVIIDMAAQIADGMSYLEKQKYVHRDVRAANILVGENNTVKVADFGLARLIAPDEDDEEIYQSGENTKFPVKWTAPEAATSRTFSTKSDVWSYGILLYEMITFGRIPYPGMDNQETIYYIKAGQVMKKPENCQLKCPDQFYDIMRECWRFKPHDRPTFEYLYHYFDNYDRASEAQYMQS